MTDGVVTRWGTCAAYKMEEKGRKYYRVCFIQNTCVGTNAMESMGSGNSS